MIRPAVPYPAALTPASSKTHDVLGMAARARWWLAVFALVDTFLTVVALSTAMPPFLAVCGVSAVAAWFGFWYMGRLHSALWRAYGKAVQAEAQRYADAAALQRQQRG